MRTKLIGRLPASTIPKTYNELAAIYTPEPILTEKAFEDADDMIEWLAGHDLNEEQSDYLSDVTKFYSDYESQHMEP